MLLGLFLTMVLAGYFCQAQVWAAEEHIFSQEISGLRELEERITEAESTSSGERNLATASAALEPKKVAVIKGEGETVYHASWAQGANSVIATQTSLLHLAKKGASPQALEALRELNFDHPELKDLFDEDTLQRFKDAYFPQEASQTAALVALNTLAVDPVSRQKAEELIRWVEASQNNEEKNQRFAIAGADPELQKRAAALVSKKGTITIINPDGSQRTAPMLVVDVAATRHAFEMLGLVPRQEVGVGNKFIVDIINPKFAETLGWRFDKEGNPYKEIMNQETKIEIEVEQLPEVLVMSPSEKTGFYLEKLYFSIRKLFFTLF